MRDRDSLILISELHVSTACSGSRLYHVTPAFFLNLRHAIILASARTLREARDSHFAKCMLMSSSRLADTFRIQEI
jgi:hypothetical protein